MPAAAAHDKGSSCLQRDFKETAADTAPAALFVYICMCIYAANEAGGSSLVINIQSSIFQRKTYRPYSIERCMMTIQNGSVSFRRQ